MKPYKCRVEYLESSGTQYIDTGIKGKNNLEVIYKGYKESKKIEPKYDLYVASWFCSFYLWLYLYGNKQHQ